MCFDLFLTLVLCRLKPATGRFLYGGTILALARKIANANIKICSIEQVFSFVF